MSRLPLASMGGVALDGCAGLRVYDQAIAADPRDLDLQVELGDLFLAKYNGTDARETYEKVLARDGEHAGALVGLARVERFEGASELETDLDRLSREARREQPEASRRLAEAAGEIRDRKIREKILYSRGVVQQRSREYARNFEADVAGALGELSGCAARRSTSPTSTASSSACWRWGRSGAKKPSRSSSARSSKDSRSSNTACGATSPPRPEGACCR